MTIYNAPLVPDMNSKSRSFSPFTRYNLLSNRLPGKCLYTRYSRLSNRFDNRLCRVYKHLTGCQTRLTTGLTNGCILCASGCQTGCTIRFDNRLNGTVAVRSTRLSNPFDNRLDLCLHDTAGCQTGCRTGLTTGCIV